MRGSILSALAGLILSASLACAASDGRTSGDIGGARAATVAIDRLGPGVDVDLELILAVDVSNSMSGAELVQQRNGYVAAFRHPDVFEAIASGPHGRIAVAYMEWAGPDDQWLVLPWTVLAIDDDSVRFAARLAAARLKPEVHTARNQTGTSISAALTFAAGLLGDDGFNGLRRAIDISGDGPNNSGLQVAVARDAVLSQGITINGLPLIFGKRTLPIDAYYQDCVIGGPGSFSVTVYHPDEFAAAIRRKLLLEIADLRPGAMARGLQDPPPHSSPKFCDYWHRGTRGLLYTAEPWR